MVKPSKDINILDSLKLDYLHLDVIDGKFASDFTMGTSIISKIQQVTKTNLDYHLMVNEPSNIFDTFDFKK